MLKLLIGGSPCTYWSIANSRGRETDTVGTGWELFKNYIIAKEKFKPDYFLYENNKTISENIKHQISKELGVELMYINSALVSAQWRERFYGFNWEVEQPLNRNIYLKDVLGIKEEKTYEDRIVMQRKETKVRVRKYEVDRERLATHLKEKKALEGLTTKEIAQRCSVPLTQASHWFRVGKYFSIPPSEKWFLLKDCLNIKDTEFDKAIQEFEERDGVFDMSKRVYHIKGKHPTLMTCNINKYNITDGEKFYSLSPEDWEDLQTLPRGYTRGVSDVQRYKALGNGWTAEVIIHILQGVLKDISKDEEICVLSLYDGIGTGRYCLDKMGFRNVKYYAYEIDKYAKIIAKQNYPDIIHCGDAFDIRKSNWSLDKVS